MFYHTQNVHFLIFKIYNIVYRDLITINGTNKTYLLSIVRLLITEFIKSNCR